MPVERADVPTMTGRSAGLFLPAALGDALWLSGSWLFAFRFSLFGFRLPASGFRLPASGFRLPASGIIEFVGP
ncbi:hypothetical protein WS70_19160 [Burkholderia mayonis]|uniref:Uncharacterized protein n=1 Tax=Burkholderia mayonis TaxID=1385591 RepID=A0A1B4FK54_9BURK|nr:hypothetical protein WS70_19160 [Burkholderia mayonis]KVE49256.1 hypothetical protein WS70_20540 [Burkholderia mayonis]